MSNLEQIVQTYYRAFNERNFAAYGELFTSDTVVEAPGARLVGVEGVQMFDRGWLEAFPKARIEAFRMTTAGDVVVSGNWFHAGPHQGTLKTAAGDIPPTGVHFEAPYCSLFELQAGKIKLQRLLFDPDFVPLKLGLRR
jgi:ketosteroid isomerase-like protein